MVSGLIGLLYFGATGASAPQERVASVVGDLRLTENFESKILGNSRTLRVWLPPEYDANPARSYSVLYMNDGQNLYDGRTSYIPNKEWRVDEAMTGLLGAKLVEPLIVVGVDNGQAQRANEYLPTETAQRDGSKWGGRADDYGRFLIGEVMPWVNKTYRTKTGPRHTGIAGSSFGGIVTLHLAMTRPDVFGKAAVVSPSLWWDGELMTKRAGALKSKLPVKFWIDMGTKEGQDSVRQLQALRDAFTTKGWKLGKDLAFYVDGGAVHNEDAWAGRLDSVLTFLFPPGR